MGFLSALFNTGKLNADPNQQAIAKALIEAVENDGGIAISDIADILTTNGWSKSEASNRLAHAASMTKVWRPDLYPQVGRLAASLNEAVYKSF